MQSIEKRANKYIDLKSQIAVMQAEAEAIRDGLIAELGPGDWYEGSFRVNIIEKTKNTVDTKKLEEHLGSAVIDPYRKATHYLQCDVKHVGKNAIKHL